MSVTMQAAFVTVFWDIKGIHAVQGHLKLVFFSDSEDGW